MNKRASERREGERCLRSNWRKQRASVKVRSKGKGKVRVGEEDRERATAGDERTGDGAVQWAIAQNGRGWNWLAWLV